MEEPWYASVSRCITVIVGNRGKWNVVPGRAIGVHTTKCTKYHRFDPPRYRFSNRELTCHHVKYEFLFFHSHAFSTVFVESARSVDRHVRLLYFEFIRIFLLFFLPDVIRKFRITGTGCFSSKWNMLCFGSCSGYSCWQSVS